MPELLFKNVSGANVLSDRDKKIIAALLPLVVGRNGLIDNNEGCQEDSHTLVAIRDHPIAASAMGMTRTQRFRLVELPLAMPGIISALRVAAVTVIGLVTVGGLFGLGGFGNLIDDGLTRDFPTPIVIGVVGSVALALVVDGGLWTIGRLTIPWNRPAKAVSGG